jgi:hypothetical protein
MPAGITSATTDIGYISDEEWVSTFKVNIHAMFYLVKASDLANPLPLAYATTKDAIQNFTGGLAQMPAASLLSDRGSNQPLLTSTFWHCSPESTRTPNAPTWPLPSNLGKCF